MEDGVKGFRRAARQRYLYQDYDTSSNLLEGLPWGYFLGPNILQDVNVDMSMAKEEAFGPVSVLTRADSLDQAIEWINTMTNLGHSASIMTQSGKNARKYIREVNVGMLQ